MQFKVVMLEWLEDVLRIFILTIKLLCYIFWRDKYWIKQLFY